MASPAPLPASALYRACTLDGLAFETTADLVDLPGIVGQERAREAVELGVGVRSRGYNLFVLGPAGLGKRSLVQQMLQARAELEPAPPDWCYVNNFKQPHRPRALELPRGHGVRLRHDMEQFVEELRASIPAMFESEEYRSRAEQIDAEISERQEKAFVELGQEASRENIALLHTPAGFSLAPARNGEVITPEQYEQLPETQRAQIEAKMNELQEKLQKVIHQVQRLQKEKRARIKQLGREMTMVAVGTLIEELKATYAALPEAITYLDEVQADVLESMDEFRRSPEAESGIPALSAGEAPAFRRYQVNVIVGDGQTGSGAPVVVEDHPTYPNLLGRVEYVARFGTLVTDFALIKAGALHRANGGYLLIDAYKLLTQPFSWEGLKRALSTGQMRTEALAQTYGLVSTVALEPEPIPLNAKVVLLGERLIYYLLLAYDPEFGELFKVQADFEDEIERSAQHEALYARLIATLIKRESLLPFDRGAVTRVIEQSARWSGDGEHLSAQLEALSDLLREAAHVVRRGGGSLVGTEHVQQALDAKERRADRIRTRIREAILRGELLIDTAGEQVGRVNGLSVAFAGDYAFAFPTRITANTHLGEGEVIDIQREVELSGPIHSKGVMILASFLAARYSSDRPLSLGASLVFEQTYGMVEGDSASVAELCALQSSLGGFPLKQSLAVTGSVNQHGEVQPIGGVNEKIEGFFDICRARGLTGTQGVIVPAANVKHLMLRRDVVDAVSQGSFAIYAVSHVDQAAALLSGLSAGEPDADGNFPEGSVNFRVAARLLELSLMRQAYASMSVKVKKVRESKLAPVPPKKPPEPGKPHRLKR
ncbi:MAG TPA: ATP-binding protein [Burkholderiales bacterium]|nr:ATP-binding protein [Burkholderiales bacterium]